MTPQKILDFWFTEIPKERWFQKSDEFDTLLRDTFTDLVVAACRGELASWRETTSGRVAEIIVLDQFSRNIWRDTPEAFAQDAMALVLSQECLRQPDFSELSADYRKFALMPFMHSESAMIHNEAVGLFEQYTDPVTLDFEIRHKNIVDRFGRYPHRNEILGRISTPEEVAFLEEPGSSF